MARCCERRLLGGRDSPPGAVRVSSFVRSSIALAKQLKFAEAEAASAAAAADDDADHDDELMAVRVCD